jgi:hypothetical protein
MSRSREQPAPPTGNPTLTAVDLYRFCVALLDWDGVHVVGEEREGDALRVLLANDEGEQRWCDSLEACEAFRAQFGVPA